MKQIIVFFIPFLSFSQTFLWEGESGDAYFFNENNWVNIVSGEYPPTGSINPNEPINFDLNLNCDVYTSLATNIASETTDIFDFGPNSTWPYIYTVATIGDGNNGSQHTFEINITSLPEEGSNYRIIKTVANGNWYFPNPSALTLGLNTLYVNSVNFDRSVKIQFSSGAIAFDSITLNGNSIYNSPGESIILNSSNSLEISNGSLEALSISGGNVILNENSYLYITEPQPISNETFINFNSGLAWLCMKQVNPNTVYEQMLSQILVNNSDTSYPTNLRLDNYYSNGTIIRPEISETFPLSVYSNENLNGTESLIGVNEIYSDSSIPNQMNNNINSFFLKKGYMVTLASNSDGTGSSQVFIASEKDLEIHSLPSSLQSNISFIRVVPWNWVSKRGTAGDIYDMNNTWFYRWNNQGVSDLQREYAPMAWGYGAANDDSDILIYKSKYKSTHVLGFNEPDDCNGQSGQYNNLCDEATAVAVYENLMKTGLRMVSPACRQGAVFSWLNSFNQLAIENDIRIDVIAVHWYDWNSNPQNSPNADPENIFNRFKTYLNNVHTLYGLPIWITEFNANKYRTTEVNKEFMELAIPYLESNNFIERYSWFEPSPVDPATVGNGEYFDTNMDHTDIGLFYKNYPSSPAISEPYHISSNNLIDEIQINHHETVCMTENSLTDNAPVISNNDVLLVYPNPATQMIRIVFSSLIRKFEIFNINGVFINKEIVNGFIDISDLAPGLYIIKVNNYHSKFIKK